MSNRRGTGAIQRALNREATFAAVQMQADAELARQFGAFSNRLVGARLEVVQADPDLHAPVRITFMAALRFEQRPDVGERRRKRPIIEHIGRDHRTNADVYRRLKRRPGAKAHVEKRGRARQQRFAVGRDGRGTRVLVGQHRLLALDGRDPSFELQSFGAATGEAGMRMAVGVHQPRHQRAALRVDVAQGGERRCRAPAYRRDALAPNRHPADKRSLDRR